MVAAGIFIIAEKMADTVVVKFAVIAPSYVEPIIYTRRPSPATPFHRLLFLMLFITAMFIWNRAKGVSSGRVEVRHGVE